MAGAYRSRARRGSAGFTLTEVMVVTVILGIMAAISTPLLTKDNRAHDGRDFAYTLARDLQRCRSEAVSGRLAVRAFIFSNRVELRSWIAGAKPGAAPKAPAVSDPTTRVINARNGVVVLNAVSPTADAPNAEALATDKAAHVDFLSQGGAQLVGQPVPTGATIYIQNNDLPSNSPDFDYRIDITALTAFVSVRTR